MTTVRALIDDALHEIEAVAAEESPENGEFNRAFRSLNRLQETWNIDRGMVFEHPATVLPLVPQKSTYTMGPGGDISLRPNRIDSASFTDLVSGYVRRLWRLTDDQFRTFRLPSRESTFAYWFYNDQAHPVSTLTVYPVPTASNQVTLYPWFQLLPFASLDEVIDLPPVYETALFYNLCVWAAPQFGIKDLSPILIDLATSTKKAIERLNVRPEELRSPPGMPMGSGRRGFLIRDFLYG